jgi:hypothetical protein
MVCTHEYCTACIISHVKSELNGNGSVVRCPGCIGGASSSVMATTPIPPKGHGLFDPWLVGKVLAKDELARTRFIRSGQIGRFAAIDGTTIGTLTKCPSCFSTIIGKVSADAARCTNATCGMLVCKKGCDMEFHGTKTCDEAMGLAKAEDDSKNEAYLAKTAKKCPRCGVYSQHFRGHGCHHIHCKSCAHEFCYCCLGEWDSLSRDHRCPVFCNERCNCVHCDICTSKKSCAECNRDYHCDVCQGRVERPDYSST